MPVEVSKLALIHLDPGSNPTVNFHGQRRTNTTHQSTTDPDARLYKKARGREARLGYLGHVLMEHRSGLIVQTMVTPADGYGERDAAVVMVERVPGRHRITVAADKGYQDEKCITGMRALRVIPLVAEFKASKNWKNWLQPSEREHPGFASSQKTRRRVEKVFAWIKTVAGLRQTKLRGRKRIDWLFRLTAAAHNLVRMVKLVPAP